MIRLAIRRPVAVTMAYLALALLGVAAWRAVPVELLPDTDLPRLTVEAEWPGASPETTEAFLTSPLEAEVQRVRGVRKVSSVSSDRYGRGHASISVEFARGTDMEFARLDLSERIAALRPELPRGVRRVTVTDWVPEEFSEQNRPVLGYTVTGPHTLEALRAHVEERLAPELRQVEGVAGVAVYGGRERVLEIELDEARVRALGLELGSVRARLLELESVSEAGRVEEGGLLRTVSVRERPETLEEVLAAPLLTTGGRVVRLQDVARVRATLEEATSYYRIDGRPAVQFALYRRAGANTVRTADAVKARLAELEGAHPAGVRLILDRDQSADVRAQLSDLRFRALFAAGVIFLVLLTFLRSVPSAAIIFATIAFSVMIAVILIHLSGLTLNVLTLMGLAMGFGLIVDNAIVVLENVFRHRRRGEGASVAAERGAGEVVLPIVAATLTTLVVLVPFVYLQGELRVYYLPLAVVVGFSLLASLFVAFSFIPGLAARLLAGSGAARTAGAAGAAGAAPGGLASSPAGSPRPPALLRPPLYERAYGGLIGLTLRFPWTTVALAAGLLWGSWHLFDNHVQRGAVWRGWGAESTYIDIRFSLPRGEELERTDELVRYFEGRLATMPEVERFETHVRPGWAFVRVSFPEELERTAVPLVIKEQLVAFSHLFGGAEVRVYGYGPSFYGGGASPPNYSIAVLGYNYEAVREIAEDLGRRLRTFSRIQDVDTNASGSWFVRDRASEFVLELDRERLALHGLTAEDVVAHVGAAARGQLHGAPVRLGGDEMQVALRYSGHGTLDDVGLRELLVPSPAGVGVRLADVATLREREVLSRIVREDQQYQRRVAYEFRGPPRLGDAVNRAVLAATLVPAGYRVEGRQQWSWSREEREQIYGVLLLSIVLIFMVTATLFESLRQPLCVLLAVPMALVGVFLAFYLSGASFTREAYIGVIMMGGIVVNNAILLVDHVNLRRRRDGLELADALRVGTLERVRPILMTSATTILGLLPLVLFSASADANIWNALGYALVGGLASSTIFILTVTPALYLIFERGWRAGATGRTPAPAQVGGAGP